MMGEIDFSPLLFERGGICLDSFWFKHHINSYQDKKHKMLRKKYGIEGYGLYWYLIEALADDDEHMIGLNEYTISSISTETLLCEEKIFEYIHDAIEVNLIQYVEADGECFILSEWLNEMMERIDEVMAARSAAGRVGAESRWHNTPKKRVPKIFNADSPEIELSKTLVGLLHNVAPEVWTPRYKKDWQKWAYEFDKMMRLDGRSFDHINAVIKYSLSSDFWKDKILDPIALRKHFDKLYQQSKSTTKPLVKPQSHKLLED